VVTRKSLNGQNGSPQGRLSKLHPKKKVKRQVKKPESEREKGCVNNPGDKGVERKRGVKKNQKGELEREFALVCQEEKRWGRIVQKMPELIECKHPKQGGLVNKKKPEYSD